MDPSVALTIASGEIPLLDIDLTVVIQFGLFVTLFLIARARLFKPYLAMREARSAGIEGARAEAVRMQAEAAAKLADYQQKLATARARALDEQRKIRAEGVAHEREVTDKARATATAAISEATQRVRAETAAARTELMPKADAIATHMAERLLGRRVA